jgi:RNA polymerase sigma-70 factor (ECF subfamily)
MDRLTTWLTHNVRWLMRQLRQRGRTREEAEDLIQEAYLRVYQYCERVEAREPERVLVRTVIRLAINDTRDRRRRAYSNQPIEELSLIDPSPSAEERIAAERCLDHLARTLETVAPRTREAFLLHRMDGLSYPQIARQMKISVSAVEKHIAWALAVLLDAVAREDKGK